MGEKVLARFSHGLCTTLSKQQVEFFFHNKSSILPFSSSEIVLFVFQLSYVQRIEVNNMFSDIFSGKRC